MILAEVCERPLRSVRGSSGTNATAATALARMALSLLLACEAAPACAQNLLANADFATGSSGWTIAGSAVFDDTSGSPTAGSVHLSNATGSASVSQCISPFTPQPVDLLARFYTSNSASLALASAVAYDGLNCTGSVLVGTSVNTNSATPGFPGTINGSAQTWNEISTVNQGLTTVGTKSVSVSVGVLSSGGPSEDVWFDLVRFGPSGTAPVRLQAFDVE